MFPQGIGEHQVDVKMRTPICFAFPFPDIDHLCPFREDMALEYLSQHGISLRSRALPIPMNGDGQLRDDGSQ
jgi:hypothetical protein